MTSSFAGTVAKAKPWGRSFGVCLAVVLGLSASNTAEAGIVIYTDSASFQNAQGPNHFLETFNTFTPNSLYSSPQALSGSGFTFNVIGDPAGGLHSGTASLPLLGNAVAGGPTSVEFTGSQVVHTVSLNAFTTNSSWNPDGGPITITLNGVVTLVVPTTSAATFYGVTDTDPITSISIMTPSATEYTAIANLNVGNFAAVPEPSAFVLAGLGMLGGLFGLSRRRRAAVQA